MLVTAPRLGGAAYVNIIGNPTLTGSVAGTPGTLPTNASLGGKSGNSFASTALTSQVIGSGVDVTTAIPLSYVDIRFTGTMSATGGFTVFFQQGIPMGSAAGYSISAYSAIVGGTTTGIAGIALALDEFNGGSYLTTAITSGLSFGATLARTSQNGITQATTTNGNLYYDITVTAGAVVDMTLRFAGPQIETGRTPTPFQTSFQRLLARHPGLLGNRPLLPTPPQIYGDTAQATLTGWNPADQIGGVTLGSVSYPTGNILANLPANSAVRSRTSHASGKWYLEATISFTSGFDTNSPIFGFAGSGFSLSTTLGTDANSIAVYPGDSTTPQKILYNNVVSNWNLSPAGSALLNGETVAICCDLDNGSYYFITPAISFFGPQGWNGTGLADPAHNAFGIGAPLTGPVSVVASGDTDISVRLNTGEAPFFWTIPVGFQQWDSWPDSFWTLSETTASSDTITPATFAATATLPTETAASSDARTPATFAVAASLSDSAASSDSIAGTFTPATSLTDSAASSDTLTPTFAQAATLASETAATSDTLTPATFAVSATLASETAASSDSRSAVLGTLTLADSATSSDTLTPATFAATATAPSESAISSDGLTPTLAASGSLSESASASDSATGALAAAGSLSDSTTSSDASAAALPATSVGDSAASSDALTPATFAASASRSETAASSDSDTAAANETASVSETATSSEALSGVAAASGSSSDSVATSESLTSTASDAASLSDSVVSSDLVASFGTFDNASSSDSLTAIGFGLTLAETTASSDSVVGIAFSQLLSESAASSDTLAITAISLNLAETTATSASPSASADESAARSETTATSDTTVVTGYGQTLADTAADSDAAAATVDATATLGETTVSGEVLVIAGSSIADTVSTSDAVVFIALGLVLSETTVIGDTPSAILTAAAGLTDTAAASDAAAAAAAFPAALSDSNAAASATTLSATAAETVALPDTGTATDATSATGAFVVNQADSATTGDILAAQTRAFNDSAASTDSLLSVLGINRSLIDVSAIVDTYGQGRVVSAARLEPIEPGRDVLVPTLGRRVLVTNRSHHPVAPPSTLDRMDPADVDVFQWDFGAVAFPGDPLVLVEVAVTPSTLTVGPPLLFGNAAQVFIGPAVTTPLTYGLEVSATFGSGRKLDSDIFLSVEPL
jgi:hypothetical protein